MALYLASTSLRRIRASGGTLGGEGMAEAGRILGAVGTVILLLGLVAAAAQIAAGAGAIHPSR